uniref:uncharacterized protein LOC128929222 n=1 Tax=Callithrix jacchus TaxID=9483 RepID=UPI0023DCF754|nr:uncharacterized protein LOC128929222 [Callithrix jacchus]
MTTWMTASSPPTWPYRAVGEGHKLDKRHEPTKSWGSRLPHACALLPRCCSSSSISPPSAPGLSWPRGPSSEFQTFSGALSCSSSSPQGSGRGLLLQLLRAWASRVSVAVPTVQFPPRGGSSRCSARGTPWRLVWAPPGGWCGRCLEVAVAPPGGYCGALWCPAPRLGLPGCVAAAPYRGGGARVPRGFILICLRSSRKSAVPPRRLLLSRSPYSPRDRLGSGLRPPTPLQPPPPLPRSCEKRRWSDLQAPGGRGSHSNRRD